VARRGLEAVDRLAPPRGEPGSLERFRTRAATGLLAVGGLDALLSLPFDALAGLWCSALLAAGLAAACALLLHRLRQGASVLASYVGFSSALGAHLLASAFLEHSTAMSAVAWTVVIPLTGLLLVGVRAELWGALAGLCLSGVIVAAGSAGLDVHLQPEISWAMASLRFVALLGAVLLLATSLEVLREQAMHEAALALRARALFLANISHELRTPMNGVLGLTELVLGSDLRPEQREQLELARRSGKHLVTILSDMLDLTRVESGRLQLEALPVDLRSFVEDLAAVYRPAALRRGLRLEAAVRPEVPAACLLDPTRVRQVLTNLVGNALKFTPAGEVTLEVSVADRLHPRLDFVVRDTGIGIPIEARERLFKPFSQVDDSHTRRFGGTGLGLALGHQLAAAMQGTLSVESTPGQGSAFTLRLPCLPTERPPEVLPPTPERSSISGVQLAPPQPAAPPEVRFPALALVVDDNPINLRVARGLVERLGYPVDTATNGREALEKLGCGDYLFVLMDCHMPEVDGLAATRAVRALGGHRAQVPVIAVTASVLPEDVAACLAAGMSECLAKPLDPAALRATLRRILPSHPPPPELSPPVAAA
jgi:signal transduction histidine kinase/CheY-like chemotaxis protein